MCKNCLKKVSSCQRGKYFPFMRLKETEESLKRMWGRLLFWLRFKRKTSHDKDTFENARVLLLLVGASRKKDEEVVLWKKAQQLISHTISWQEIIIFSSKTFRVFWQLSYWNPRHTIICGDVILWEQFTQNRYSRRSIKFQIFIRKKSPSIFLVGQTSTFQK